MQDAPGTWIETVRFEEGWDLPEPERWFLPLEKRIGEDGAEGAGGEGKAEGEGETIGAT